MLHNCYKEISADVNVWFYCLISQEFDAILEDFFILETKYNSALSAITEVGKVREGFGVGGMVVCTERNNTIKGWDWESSLNYMA